MDLIQEIKTAASGHGHGCTCTRCMETYCGGDSRGLDRGLMLRLIAAAVLFAAGLFTASVPVVPVLLFILSILAAGYDWCIRGAVNCVRSRRVNEDLLMFAAVIAAVAIGRPAEAAAAVILIRLGDLLLCRSLEKGYRSIEAMANERSDEAWDILEEQRSGQAEKSGTEGALERFSRIYTNVVLGVAVVIAVVLPLVFHTTMRDGIYRALILLVIACPCAVVKSIPLSFSAGIGGAAGRGVLFRSSAALERIGRTDAVVFDKKGALEGDGLRVVSVKSDRMEADVLLRIAAHACAYSDGVYAECIKAAYQDTIYIELIQSFQQDPGQGITVEVDGVKIVIGLESFVRDHGVDPGEDRLDEPCAYLAIDGQYAGRIVFGCVPRADAVSTVKTLSWERDRSVVLVSDEAETVAERFARAVGAGECRARCTEDDKLALIRVLRGSEAKPNSVMFVGSADLDEAALSEADTGVALGASDAAFRAADVVILEDSLSGLGAAMDTSRRVKKVLRRGLVIVLAIKLIILILDMLGVCPLWLAVQADAGAALIAILNAMTAARQKAAENTSE